MRFLRHKYRTSPPEERTVDGIRFDSKKEMRRYQDLLLLKAQGDIVVFLRQVPFYLPGGVKYVSDFLIFWADGHASVEDVKGVRTEQFRAKKRMVEEMFKPILIEEV